MSSEFRPSGQDGKKRFLDQAKAARADRHREKTECDAAIRIQSWRRGCVVRKQIRETYLQEFDEILGKNEEVAPESKKNIIPVFGALRKLLLVLRPEKDKERIDRSCRYLLSNVLSPAFDSSSSYMALAANRSLTSAWIFQQRKLLNICLSLLRDTRPEVQQDHKYMLIYLNMILTFTNLQSVNVPNDVKPVLQLISRKSLCELLARGLNQSLQSLLKRCLCRKRPILNLTEASAILTIALRPIAYFPDDDSHLFNFIVHILSIPALVSHYHTNAPIALTSAVETCPLKRIFSFLVVESNSCQVFEKLGGSYSLCLIANIIHLSTLNSELLQRLVPEFIETVQSLFTKCQAHVVTKQSHSSHWHLILGWFNQQEDPQLHESLSLVRDQLSCLWNGRVISALTSSLVRVNEKRPKSKRRSSALSSPVTEDKMFSVANLRKVIDRASSVVTGNDFSFEPGSGLYARNLMTPEIGSVTAICCLYETAMKTMTQIRLNILTGLCQNDGLMQNLWSFISSLDETDGLFSFLDHMALNPKTGDKELQILILFCDCLSHLITIMDDMEFYEHQQPFSLTDMVRISRFMNEITFRMIWSTPFDPKMTAASPVFVSTHTLLSALYRRDSRRPFCPTDHWIIRDVRMSSFQRDLDSGKRSAHVVIQKMPHIIPHKNRVTLFRKYVAKDKESVMLPDGQPRTTLITVHRLRIVEDGYQQLALLPAADLKGFVRVKFINSMGLDEAGIDQDGVFKEFLEETLRKVFDPSLNLFITTSEQRLYPSPTSSIHENHLSLFEFVGRVLGKAVYEGIVCDVPFAPFFLSQVLGQQQSLLYSYHDDLSSFDPDLHKNLCYVKHYDGDVTELGLTFSVDEDFMGRIISHELIPGGRAVAVTKENRIHYIHLMAHFRMHAQIKDQTAAFIRGFRSIINPDWLSLFSTPEFQRLISGDNTPIDLNDLKKHTKYYGGFHGNHRVVSWLWDILQNDFTAEEHKQFLKFVTSSSKPPLLGFAYLEPPFSVRCVEVGDDVDTGDTVGSVLRGFFTIRRKDPVNRLPTSSTCFNLLKLPNYQKKSTLRDKLRYAIQCNTGFELS